MEEADKVGLLSLDNLCLDRVLNYCNVESCVSLSETCVRIRECTKRRIRKYRFLYIEITSLQSMKSAVKLIRHVGKHLTDFGLEFESQNDLTPSMMDKFFEFLVDNIPNVRDLQLTGRLCHLSQIYILGRLFRQLQTLSISHYCNDTDNLEHAVCFYTIDLPGLCPNLRSLTANGLVHFTPNPVKSINGLLKLGVWRDRCHSQILWRRLLQQHRDLKKLTVRDDISYNNPCIDLDDVAQHSRNLEEFEVSVRLIRHSNQLSQLGKLQNLRTLNLVSITPCHTNMISTNLHTLKQLYHLYLHFDGCVPILLQKMITNVAVDLPNLKTFQTGAVVWEEETLIDFIRHSSNLEVLTIHAAWNYTWNSELLRKLVDARRWGAKQDQPLKVVVSVWCPKYDGNFKKVAKEPEIKRFIEIVDVD